MVASKDLAVEYKALCLAISLIDTDSKFFHSEEGLRFHFLKCETIHFNHAYSGRKKFETRKNDRDYRDGDFLVLREYLYHSDLYTGNYLIVKVNYLSDFVNGYVVMQFEVVVECSAGCIAGLSKYLD